MDSENQNDIDKRLCYKYLKQFIEVLIHTSDVSHQTKLIRHIHYILNLLESLNVVV